MKTINFRVPTITTMGDLADYINAADEWPLDVCDIIERNGWVSDCGTSWGICHNDTEKVVFNDDGVAIVLDVEKTLEEIAYENGLEIVETTSERTGYPSHMMDALTGFSSFAEAKRIADEHNLTLIWIDQRDGWQNWHRGDMASEPMSINSSDFGETITSRTIATTSWRWHASVLPTCAKTETPSTTSVPTWKR